jgi:hypothetical protein
LALAVSEAQRLIQVVATEASVLHLESLVAVAVVAAGITLTLVALGGLEVEVVSARGLQIQGAQAAQGLQAKEILVEVAEETSTSGSTAGVAVAVELVPKARRETSLWVTAV